MSEAEKPDMLLSVRDPKVVEKRRASARRKKWLRRGLLAMVLLLLVVAAALAARPKPVVVELAEVRRGRLEVTVEEAGRTRVRDRYVVVAPLAGELARITLRAGDAIARGAPLARIVPQAPALLDPRSRAEATARLGTSQSAARQAQANVERAALAVEHAQRDRERVRRLYESGSVSEAEATDVDLEARLRAQELASARFAAETAAHEVGMASAALARYSGTSKASDAFEVLSPITGRVLRVLQPSAGVVLPSAQLVEVGDPAELEVVVDVLTEDAVRIPHNAKVTLERWGGPWPLAGHVRVVEPSAFTRLSSLGVEEQRVSVVIDFDEPLERRKELGDGYRVEARVVVWAADDVVLLPSSAVFRRSGGWAVYVEEDGIATLRQIEIGQRGTADVQVLSGIEPGARVILHPSDRVAEEVKVVGH